MLSISDHLSTAVRAAIALPVAERARFVGEHLKAQDAGAPLPEASAPQRAGHSIPRAQLQEELSVLAETLTGAVNAAAQRTSGSVLANVAEHLLMNASSASCGSTSAAAGEQQGEGAVGSAPAPGVAAEKPGKGKKTARFAAGQAGPERVGEPPPPMAKSYTGGTDTEGLANGEGQATYANGDVYEGQWVGDKREGAGKCTYASGEFYEGGWKSDKRDGKGRARYVTGDTYEGEWRFGKREGQGRAEYASKDGYEGQWKADKKQGFGTFWSASGEVYEGQWLTGTYEGRGTYLYASSDVYEGEYHAGKRDGRGTYMYAGGDVYEGEYKAGKMEGRGTYRLADGTAEVGKYFAGADVGEGARWSADRKTAYRLRGGKVEEEISLEEAARIAGALGLAVPAVYEDDKAAEQGASDAGASSPSGAKTGQGAEAEAEADHEPQPEQTQLQQQQQPHGETPTPAQEEEPQAVPPAMEPMTVAPAPESMAVVEEQRATAVAVS